MARNSAEDKLEHSGSCKEEEEDEEEALSLCDLPVNLNEGVSNSREEEIQENGTVQEDFDFDGCVSSGSEMCVADDIFFKGQILPFRVSVSSENGNSIINKSKQENSNSSRCLSTSESMDHGSVGGFTSFSSRSSSSRSQFSSSSSNSSSVTIRIPNSRIQKQFLIQSSPKPPIRFPSSSLGNQNRNRKSTVWEFFRLSLVRTPEIELRDLKARNSVSRNSSTSSSSNSSIVSSSNQCKKMEKQRKQSMMEKRLLLSGCNCTVNSVKPVASNSIVIKSNSEQNDEATVEENQLELKIKKKNQKKKKQEKENGGKQAMSRHRTFEWIKELSHSSFLDHEQPHTA